MAETRAHRPVLLVVAAFSRHPEALEWGRRQCCAAWGPVVLASGSFSFTETGYYESTMGGPLTKVLWAFQRLIDPATLPDRKHESNRWEQALAASGRYAEPRPLNLDPGYLTEAKLILASTKDRDHRIYLSGGIFAENTLYYRGGRWQTRPWTYPDYRRPDYHQFLDQCRAYFRQRLET
jgi:hypothetical protein